MKDAPVLDAPSATVNFDMVRLTKSKREVDLSPNMIRTFAKDGLRLYRVGACVFFSRQELADHIRRNGFRR